MKPVLFSAAFLALFATAATATQARSLTAAPTDTIVVRLPNKAVMTLVVRDAQQLRELKKYQLDSLTSRLATYITQAETAAKAGTTDQVTMRFYPDQDQPGQNLPAEVRITARKPTASEPKGSTKTQVYLNKKFKNVFGMDSDGDITYKGKRTPEKQAADSVRRIERQGRGKVYFVFDAGLNTFVNGSSASAGVPSLDNWGFGVGYVNFGLDYVQPLVYRGRAKLALTVGPEFSFNHFQVRGNNQWVQNGSVTATETAPSAMQIDHSKLNLTTLNLPVMLRFKLKNKNGHQHTLSAGVGGFGGYRLSSSLETKYELAGDDNKYENITSGQLNLNNWQYG
ncbi:MAG: PorT family protein, partial [Hymenobacter sp.]